MMAKRTENGARSELRMPLFFVYFRRYRSTSVTIVNGREIVRPRNAWTMGSRVAAGVMG